ncbi:MAG: hypothetical protein KDA61_14775 [Planctomycetales bacterium]|nr:hypothetical protein [Planctomycetales bacterium]
MKTTVGRACCVLMAACCAIWSAGAPSLGHAATLNDVTSPALDGAGFLEWQQGENLGGVDVDLGDSTSVVVSLDLWLADPADPNSGGEWRLLALASNRGLSAMDVALLNVLGNAAFDAPAPAFKDSFDGGDKSFDTDQDGNSATYDMLFGQVPVAAPGPQDLMYDVGVPTPLSPADPLHPLNPSAINMQGAAQMASGQFAAGALPEFVAGGTAANVFIAVGTLTDPPPIGSIVAATVTTQVRTNQIPEPASALLMAAMAMCGLLSRRTFGHPHC